MPQEKAENFVITKPGRLVYTGSLIAPQAFRNSDGTTGLPRYNCQVLLGRDHPQLPALQALILKVAQAAFPGQDVTTLKLPLRFGDKLNADRVAKGKKELDFYPGNYVLFAQKPEKNRSGGLLSPPRLVVMQEGQMIDYTDASRALAKEFFFNGVLASVSMQLKAFSGFGGGVTCYLDRVLSLNVGDVIPIGRDDESVFGSADSYAEYVGHASAEAPSAGQASPW